MYAIVRGDLEMTSGKASSQAGHAFLDAFQSAPPHLQRSYSEPDSGTKIVLTVPGEKELCDLFFRAKKAKLPCSMVIEEHHIMPPHFDGSPIVTAIGIGPVERGLAKCITKGLPLLK